MKDTAWIDNLEMLPPDGRGRIRRYIEEGYGLSMSTFYRCMLSNDLIGAIQGGDDENRAALPAYVDYLTAHAPEDCYGSPEKLAAWRGISAMEA
jgi:hypothetical protein